MDLKIDGMATCPHQNRIVACPVCNGGNVCIHGKLKITCGFCNELWSGKNKNINI